MLILTTTKTPSQGLPAALLLHGWGGCARYAAVGGMADALADAVSSGAAPPFALVALDGGNGYWHDQTRGDDPMGMLLDEAPEWLRQEGLGGDGGVPFACVGVSMGGFGALLYARRRIERGQAARAVAALSPGLFTSWKEMKARKAFADEEQWASVDPLRHVDKLGGTPVGMWIGEADRFLPGARQFISEAKPEVASVAPGGHTSSYFRGVTPEIIRFLSARLP